MSVAGSSRERRIKRRDIFRRDWAENKRDSRPVSLPNGRSDVSPRPRENRTAERVPVKSARSLRRSAIRGYLRRNRAPLYGSFMPVDKRGHGFVPISTISATGTPARSANDVLYVRLIKEGRSKQSGAANKRDRGKCP